jgi:ABC-2 type transport system permease protein
VTGLWLFYAVPMLLVFIGSEFTVTGWFHRLKELLDFLQGLGLAAIYATVYAAFGLLISSFLKRRMVAAALIVAFTLVTSAVGLVVGQLIGKRDGKLIGELLSPPTLVLGLKNWVYQIPETGMGSFGPVFLVVALVLTGGSIALLHARYRRVGQ